MSTQPLAETSKFLSYVLRHEPQSIGLALDREGWAPIDTLIAAAAQHGRALDRALIEQVVVTSDKKRFSISEDGSSIRAVQGHSYAPVMSKHPFDTYYIPLLLTISALLMGIPFSVNVPQWVSLTLYAFAAVTVVLAGILAYRAHSQKKPSSRGGRGGSAESHGSGNTVGGGRGGDANGGIGGAGGDAIVKGNNSVARGGDGGAG